MGWTEVVITAAALLVASGIVWTKLLHPLYHGVRVIEVSIPPLLAAVESFKGNPLAFKVLEEIVREFRTDSGSSLRDAIDRLEKAVEVLTIAVTLLEKKAEIQVRLDEADRRQIERLAQLLDRLDVKVDLAKNVAETVAVDLAAAQGRADAVPDGEPGEAADAGMRSDPEAQP